MIDQPIEVQTRIGAPPEVVFAYFVDPELYRRWKGTTAELDARPGGLYRVLMPSGDRVRGEYVAVEPPHRVVFTWGFEGSTDLPPGSSTVEVTLHADGDGTIVRLRHERVELSGFNADDQVVLEHTTAHLAGDHERQATKHLLFLDVCPIRERRADALSELLIVRHGAHHSLDQQHSLPRSA